jgi:murein DD-endopeptidase MepM/ murein hydrolase activator NlpD
VAEDPYVEPAGGAPISAAAPVAQAPAPSYGYIWPAYGNITTYFMENGHKGIDIDGFGQYGAPIASVATGQVVLASWSDWGLGYHVIVDHGDGMRTVYAHLSEIWVSQGQYVGQGEAVGALGSTGYSTGPHLHFEMHYYGSVVDPLAYLP